MRNLNGRETYCRQHILFPVKQPTWESKVSENVKMSTFLLLSTLNLRVEIVSPHRTWDLRAESACSPYNLHVFTCLLSGRLCSNKWLNCSQDRSFLRDPSTGQWKPSTDTLYLKILWVPHLKILTSSGGLYPNPYPIQITAPTMDPPETKFPILDQLSPCLPPTSHHQSSVLLWFSLNHGQQ